MDGIKGSVEKIILISLYGTHIDVLERGIVLYKKITKDNFGRFVNDLDLQNFIEHYKDKGPAAQFSIERLLTVGHFFDEDSIWAKENGKYCTEKVKNYFLNLLYLSEIFQTLSMDLRGHQFKSMQHNAFFEKQAEIVAKYESVCFGKYI